MAALFIFLQAVDKLSLAVLPRNVKSILPRLQFCNPRHDFVGDLKTCLAEVAVPFPSSGFLLIPLFGTDARRAWQLILLAV